MSSTEEECHIDDVHDECQSVVDKKLWPAVYCLELSDCLGVRIALVTGADRTLIDHAFKKPDRPEKEVLDQGEDDIERGGLGDKAADIQEPLCCEVSVDAREERAFLGASFLEVPGADPEENTVVEERDD